MTETFIVAGARTPIGRYGGGLKSVHPAELGAVAARAAIERAAIDPGLIDLVVIGHARQAGSGPNPARQVGLLTLLEFFPMMQPLIPQQYLLQESNHSQHHPKSHCCANRIATSHYHHRPRYWA